VPADAHLLEATTLLLDESLLTGESLPVAKTAGETVYSGTLVARRHARAAVVATGIRSVLGRIGVSLAALEPEKTSLERETARIVKAVAVVAVAVCAPSPCCTGCSAATGWEGCSRASLSRCRWCRRSSPWC
jgi:Ca2+-transporting ATPase